ncbi:UbiA family prenyltransferase [Zooshikella harenae]|uniref:UbiA family prenyltransferase n=1 Tax=Zooshikella harenae TaxID=2827238 RepID=A0ABS5ZDM1_9GAMM|nr:UbiA family prenyltransferase [Zooshikella harenae]MBU2712085.1 UbiA family prenyltransferase [Zooshikella harenae]
MAQANTLSHDSPLLNRLYAWAKERFPLANALLAISLYLAISAIAKHSSSDAIPIWHDITNCFAAVSIFLLLRILDEHKDYKIDNTFHADRVLQQGYISLYHLKVLGVIAFIITGLSTLVVESNDLYSLQSWLLMLGWLTLMTFEFFSSKWLNQHLISYSFSHMLIMPLIGLWFYFLAGYSSTNLSLISLIMFLFFFSGFSFEFVRKTKPSEEENKNIPTYSSVLGISQAITLVVCCVFAVSLFAILLIYYFLTNHWWVYTIIIGTSLLCLLSLTRFLISPSIQARRYNEAAVGIHILCSLWMIIISSLTS